MWGASRFRRATSTCSWIAAISTATAPGGGASPPRRLRRTTIAPAKPTPRPCKPTSTAATATPGPATGAQVHQGPTGAPIPSQTLYPRPHRPPHPQGATSRGGPQSLKVCVDCIDDADFVNHLIYAAQRGVAVQCVVDWRKMTLTNSDQYLRLKQAKVDLLGVFCTPQDPLIEVAPDMHTKFIIFGEEDCLLGSFNITFDRWGANWESGMTFHCRGVCRLAGQHFSEHSRRRDPALWGRSPEPVQSLVHLRPPRHSGREALSAAPGDPLRKSIGRSGPSRPVFF